LGDKNSTKMLPDSSDDSKFAHSTMKTNSPTVDQNQPVKDEVKMMSLKMIPTLNDTTKMNHWSVSSKSHLDSENGLYDTLLNAKFNQEHKSTVPTNGLVFLVRNIWLVKLLVNKY